MEASSIVEVRKVTELSAEMINHEQKLNSVSGIFQRIATEK